MANGWRHAAIICVMLNRLISRLKQLDLAYEVVQIASLGPTQVFVRDPAGIIVVRINRDQLGLRVASYALQSSIDRTADVVRTR